MMDATETQVFDVLCPMHIVLNRTGHITHVGPTMARLRPVDALKGARFLEVFEMLRPHIAYGTADLMAHAGTPMRFRFRDQPETALKGVLVPLGEGAIVNTSFGISVLEGVRDYKLSGNDFAPTDLAVEMLYLIEAKSAAMSASRQLNARLQAAMISAEEQAFTDTLTGLKNRRAMEHVLDRLLETGIPFALMQIDLDFFKQVNDTLGHAAGDYVLQRVAKVLVSVTRSDDIVSRIGGDEFVLIFRSVVDREQLAGLARRMITQIESPGQFDGHRCAVSASAGTVISTDYNAPTASELMSDADVALYASKHAGRGQHTFFDPAMRLTDLPGVARNSAA